MAERVRKFPPRWEERMSGEWFKSFFISLFPKSEYAGEVAEELLNWCNHDVRRYPGSSTVELRFARDPDTYLRISEKYDCLRIDNGDGGHLNLEFTLSNFEDVYMGEIIDDLNPEGSGLSWIIFRRSEKFDRPSLMINKVGGISSKDKKSKKR